MNGKHISRSLLSASPKLQGDNLHLVGDWEMGVLHSHLGSKIGATRYRGNRVLPRQINTARARHDIVLCPGAPTWAPATVPPLVPVAAIPLWHLLFRTSAQGALLTFDPSALSHLAVPSTQRPGQDGAPLSSRHPGPRDLTWSPECAFLTDVNR